MSRRFEIKTSLLLPDVLRSWAENRVMGAATRDRDRASIADDYMIALGRGVGLALLHHKELEDADFVRFMRFAVDLGTDEFECDERYTAAFARFKKFHYSEPKRTGAKDPD